METSKVIGKGIIIVGLILSIIGVASKDAMFGILGLVVMFLGRLIDEYWDEIF